MTDETDEPEPSRKPIAFFLAVMILVSPVAYVLTSAPVLSFYSHRNRGAFPEWWEAAYAPVLWVEAETVDSSFSPMMKWFMVWDVGLQLTAWCLRESGHQYEEQEAISRSHKPLFYSH